MNTWKCINVKVNMCRMYRGSTHSERDRDDEMVRDDDIWMRG